MLRIALTLSAWEAKIGLLRAPGPLAALVGNINLQAPQKRVAVYPYFGVLLVTQRCLYAVDKEAAVRVTHHVRGLVLSTDLSFSAWEAKIGLLCAPGPLAALAGNINLQAPQKRVAVYPYFGVLLVTQRCLYAVDKEAAVRVTHHVIGFVLGTE